MHRPASCRSVAGFFAMLAFSGGPPSVFATGTVPPAAAEAAPWGLELCTVDLTLPGTMKDILSNVLTRSAQLPSDKVQAFLEQAVRTSATGADLLKATATHFGIDEPRLSAEVEAMRHVNCKHGPGALSGEEDESPELPQLAMTPFARDVGMHVLLHELGHALVREFDLPVLGNEETMADAFATHYLTTHMPERAFDVLHARVTSWMIEANDVARAEWPVRGEHDNDARRAFQVAALAIAADPVRYAPLASIVDMSEDDQKRATDYGAEIHRGWRRILEPRLMPNGTLSSEARVVIEGDTVFATDDATETIVAQLTNEIATAMKRFDWHSGVRVVFVNGKGGAAWSRSKRAITVHSGYLGRFVTQGEQAAKAPAMQAAAPADAPPKSEPMAPAASQ